MLAATTLAGIPEPGLVLRGKVLDDNDNLVTSGTLQWTFTPQGTGERVAVTTPLEELAGEDGLYFYQVTTVQIEMRAVGLTEISNALLNNHTIRTIS